MIASHMSYPDDLGLEELAEIAIESLMTIEIRKWFRRHLGLDISLVEIGNAGTVGELSRTTLKIMRKKHQAGELTRHKDGQFGRGEVVQIGLQEADEHRLCLEDQALTRDFRPIGPMIPCWRSEAEGHVFLTGVTGFVGAFLLGLLAGLPEVKEVACFVRAPDADAGMARIKKAMSKYSFSCNNMAKVVAVPGDVSASALGMGEQYFEYYARRSSVVFHLAARSKYTLPYSAHRAINVEGTVNLVLTTDVRVENGTSLELKIYSYQWPAIARALQPIVSFLFLKAIT
ncbi:hypothetical protein ASPCAL07708 [Aspergillus calidoustus]|uniref:Fatty acyl-CoA reductase n=1 Tax=Aspergillus calidoustus TaxID=454130 RepID=A0A0U5CPH7_ASPCI|nr:hypothetical protein ASPCAL07708 [Aspergillus calidoustus]